MSKITLKPLDDGQKAVEIPIGKTTIGRGPFLGCSDKKVSRNHAVLEVTDTREVFITPTHVNPCFYQPTVDSPGIILKKDKPQKLSNGDSFSLLPRAFRYQLIVTGEPGDSKSVQNDFKNQSEKTNGETSSSDELKDSKDAAPKETSKPDLYDKGSSKPPSKEDSPRGNAISISESKESSTNNQEDRIAAKDTKTTKPDQTECSEQLPKESASEHEDNEEEHENETLPERNNLTNKENDIAEKGDKDLCSDGKPLDKDEESVDESKIVDESESTLGHDVFLREDKTPKDGSAINTKDHEKDAKSDSGERSDSSKGRALDDAKDPSNASADEEDDKGSRDLPDWLEEMPTTNKKGKGGRKKNPSPKQPKKEKPPPKRKTDGTPKAKPRKKQNKFDFLDGGEGSSQRPVGERTSSRTNRQTRQGLSLEDFVVSDDDEWQSDRSEPKRRRKRGARKGGNDSGSDWEIDHKKPKKTPQKAGSGSESDTDWGSQKKKKSQGGKRRKGKTANQSETGSDAEAEPEAEEPSSFVAKGESRIPCTYGKKCYRKNPNHTDQFSHPGDSDYTSEPEVSQKPDAVSESEEEEDDPEVESKKKECPYGSNCFRKNPQHKKDFKHTKKVRPQREAAKQASKKAKGPRNSDEIDSYDLNDSLLNEDSDEYKPVDSGSDYENGGKMKRFPKGKSPKNKRGKRV